MYKSLKLFGEFDINEEYFETKIEADVHDLIFLKNNKKYSIQVKSLDSCSKKNCFNFSELRGFDVKTNKDTDEYRRWSSFYVFCYLKLNNYECTIAEKLHKKWNSNENNKSELEIEKFKRAVKRIRGNVLDIESWSFYIVPTENLPNQSTMVISKFDNLVSHHKAIKTDFDGIGLALKTLTSNLE